MFCNLELVLSADTAKTVESPMPEGVGRETVGDILPDTSEDRLSSRIPFLFIRRLKRVA